MDLFEIQKHKSIIRLASELVSLTDGAISSDIANLKSKSEKALKTLNRAEMSVCNPTLSELGRVRSSVKKVILSRCGLYQTHYYGDKSYIRKRDMVISACNDMDLPDDLTNRIILFRRQERSKRNSPIGIEITNSIKIEIIKLFESQNRELINKIL